MSDTATYPKLVSELLSKKGVPEETWALVISEIIGSSKDTARRRMLKQGDFSLTEIALIAQHFETTISSMLQEISSNESVDPSAESAFITIDGHKLPCQIVTRPAGSLPITGLYAYQDGAGELVVCADRRNPAADKPRPVVTLRIAESSFPRVKIAVVDDEAPTTLVRYLNGAGFEASHYDDSLPIIESLQSGARHDAYILDWTLSRGTTSKSLIEAIRQAGDEAPILLLTGTIESSPNNESEVGQMMADYGVEVFLKPARPFLIAQKLTIMCGLIADQNLPK